VILDWFLILTRYFSFKKSPQFSADKKLIDKQKIIFLKDDPKNVMEGDGKYLAAEVLNDKPTKAADIFSLGMTILELATDLDLPNNGVFWHEIRNRMIDEKYIKGFFDEFRYV